MLSNGTVVPMGARIAKVSVPSAVAYDPNRSELFVTDRQSNTVSVISDSANRAVAVIPVGQFPVAIAYDADQGELFVSNHNSSNVSVISEASDRVVATVPVADGPEGLAYDSATGEVFVASWNLGASTGNVAVISTATDTVVANVSVGSYPFGVAYDAGRGEVFVTNSDPGYAVGTVSVLSEANLSVVATVPVGRSPVAAAVDPVLGQVWVADAGSCTLNVSVPTDCVGGDVSVISDASDAVVAKVVGLSGPTALTYDAAAGAVFAVEAGTCCGQGRVVEISTGNDSVNASVHLDFTAVGIAYDTARGELFVPNQGAACRAFFYGLFVTCSTVAVGVLAAGHLSLIDLIYLESAPTAEVYDYVDGVFFVGEAGAPAVRVLSAATYAQLATIPLVAHTSEMVYDPGRAEVYVAEGSNSLFGSGYIGVISTVNDTVLATIPLGSGVSPAGIAYDPAKGELFVAEGYSDAVGVISVATDSLVTTVPVGGDPDAVTFDPARGEVFVASPGSCLLFRCSWVTVLSDSNNSVVAKTPVGADPVGLAVDTRTGEVYVASEFDAMSVISDVTNSLITKIPGTYDDQNVTFDPSTGLVYAFDALDNSLFALWGGKNTVVATVYPAAHPSSFTLNPRNGTVYCASMREGTFTLIVPGTTTYASFYPVTFSESGLPSGKNWTVNVGGPYVRSNHTVLSVPKENGTYAYLISGPTGWRVKGVSPVGTLGVNGSQVALAVQFVRAATYALKFVERGLPAGEAWCVNVTGSVCTTGPSLRLGGLSPGRYPYAVEPMHGQVITARSAGAPVALAGSLVIGTHGVTVHLRYTYPYNVTFRESGLPNGTRWSVKVGPIVVSSTTNTVVIGLGNGTYGFKVGKIAGYARFATPYPVQVLGGLASVTVTFRPR